MKVAGTGRLTLRNRRFLRVFTPRFPQGPTWKFERPSSPPNDNNHTEPLTHQLTLPGLAEPTRVIQKLAGHDKTPPSIKEGNRFQSAPNATGSTQQTATDAAKPTVTRSTQPTFMGSAQPAASELIQPVATRPTQLTAPESTRPTLTVSQEGQPLRRSSRVRMPRQFYDPITGGYTDQNN